MGMYNTEENLVTEAMSDLEESRIETEAMPDLGESRIETEAMPDLGESGIETTAMPDLEESGIETEAMPNLKRNSVEDNKLGGTQKIHSGLQLTSIGKYRHYVLGELVSDTGGTAEIWKVECEEEDRDFVAKIYNPAKEKKERHNRHIVKVYEDFENERVEGLIPILDHGEIDLDGMKKRYFYILPNIKTGDLINYLNSHDMSDDEVVRFIEVISGALHKMHEKGYIHRDIKPQNIMYDGKKPILIDYGSVSKGEISTGIRTAVTQNIVETQGYTAPEVLGYYGAAKNEMIATEKSDFFALGTVIAEIYKTMELRKAGKLFTEDGKRKDTRLFPTDVIMTNQVSNNDIAWSNNFLEKKRMHNLVSALLVLQPEYRAGYNEIREWLQGNELIIHYEEEKKVQFNYYFNSVQYKSKEDLVFAMGNNWAAGIEEIKDNIETLKDYFKDLAKKSPVYYKTIFDFLAAIDSYYDNSNYEKTVRFDAELAETLMCIGGKDVPFMWKGKIYSDEKKQTDKEHWVEEIYYDAKNDGNNFDALVKTRVVKEILYEDIRYVRDTSNDEDKKKVNYHGKIKRIEEINEIAIKNPRKAKYYVAEQIKEGFLVEKLSGGKFKASDEYLKSIFTNENFDRAMKDIYYDNKNPANSIIKFLEDYSGDEEIPAMLLGNFGIDMKNAADTSKMSKEIKLLMLIRDLLNADEKYTKNGGGDLGIFNAFYNSNFRKAVSGMVTVLSGYIFEDRINAKEASKASEIIKGHAGKINEYEPVLNDFSSKNFFSTAKQYIDEFVGILKNIESIKALVVYDRELLSSGLIFVSKDNLNSSIYATDEKCNFCLLNDRFLLPLNVANELYAASNVKISAPEQQNRVRELSIINCCKYVDALFNGFRTICGAGIEKKADIKVQNLWVQLVLSFLVVATGISLVISGAMFLGGQTFLKGLIDKKYGIFIIAADFALGLLLSLGCGFNLKGAIGNLKLFKQNKDMYAHYLKIQTAANIVQSMKISRKIKRLSEEQKEIVDISYNLGNPAASYFQKYSLSGEGGKYYKHRIFSVIFVGILGFVLFIFNILPVRNMAGALFASNIDYAAECNKDSDGVFTGLNQINKFLLKTSLRMTEKDVCIDLINSFNETKLNEESYMAAKDKYYEICDSCGYSLSENSKKTLEYIIQSKEAFAKGSETAASDEKKTVQYYLNVIPEDNFYDDAQRFISSHLGPLHDKQQNCFEKGNTKGLEKVIKKYKDLLTENDNGSFLKDQYDILVNYDLNEAARRLAALQLYLNREKWSDPDISIVCTKVETGKYNLYVKKKNYGISAFRSKYSCSHYWILTYGVYLNDEGLRDFRKLGLFNDQQFDANKTGSDFTLEDYLKFIPE